MIWDLIAVAAFALVVVVTFVGLYAEFKAGQERQKRQWMRKQRWQRRNRREKSDEN